MKPLTLITNLNIETFIGLRMIATNLARFKTNKMAMMILTHIKTNQPMAVDMHPFLRRGMQDHRKGIEDLLFHVGNETIEVVVHLTVGGIGRKKEESALMILPADERTNPHLHGSRLSMHLKRMRSRTGNCHRLQDLLFQSVTSLCPTRSSLNQGQPRLIPLLVQTHPPTSSRMKTNLNKGHSS